MERNIKTSTDPQENEIDSNYLGKLFHMLWDDEKETQQRVIRHQNRTEEDFTLDEIQDPANHH